MRNHNFRGTNPESQIIARNTQYTNVYRMDLLNAFERDMPAKLILICTVVHACTRMQTPLS